MKSKNLKLSSKLIWRFFFVLLLCGGLFIGGCAQKEKQLIVCCGKALENPMEAIKSAFKQKHKARLEIIYASSTILLDIIKKTKRGDVFIPGSVYTIKKAGDLVDNHQYVAVREPIIYVHKDNPKNIQSFDDLAEPGVRIVTGNVIGGIDRCLVAKIFKKIIAKSGLKEQIIQNIVINAPTCSQIMDVLIKREADAGINMKHNLALSKYKDLKGIEIPSHLNEKVDIHVAVLTTSKDKKTAQLLAGFIASEGGGKAIFKKHGFSEK